VKKYGDFVIKKLCENNTISFTSIWSCDMFWRL